MSNPLLDVAADVLPSVTEQAGESTDKAAPMSQPAEVPPTVRDAPYSPWSTVLPRAWAPVVEVENDRVDLGAAVDGIDVLARHVYQIRVTRPIVRPTLSEGIQSSDRLDWQIAYAYARWWPSLFVVASTDTDSLQIGAVGTSAPLTAASATREIFAGIQLPVRRVRWSQLWMTGVTLVDQRTTVPDGELRRIRNGVRAGWLLVTAREHGYSISPERGGRVGVTLEHLSPRFGADGTSTTGTIDARVYVPMGVPHAVLAVRGTVGLSRGDASMMRVFTNGGRRSSPWGLAFGHDALGLLRGFEPDALRGSAVTTFNADYRFPIANIERGAGTWPIFLNTIQGALFADVGTTGQRLSALSAPSSSVGVECAATATIGYGLRFTLAGGLAWTRRGGGERADRRPAVFVRTGYAF